jgi:hypothetical protein
MQLPLNPIFATSLPNPGQLFQAPVGPVLPALPTNKSSSLSQIDQGQFSIVSQLLSPFEQLSLPPIKSTVPSLMLRSFEPSWQAVKDTFTYQYAEMGSLGTTTEAENNCGPATASMILKQYGIYPPTMQQLRRSVGAPIGFNGTGFALTTKQVAEAVKRTAHDKGKFINYETRLLTANVDNAAAEMRYRLSKGEKLILLTSGFNSLSEGHFTVVKEVLNDGSIIVDDPSIINGENQYISRSRFAKALETRKNYYAMENCLIVFNDH